jgi:hypothetical protein
MGVKVIQTSAFLSFLSACLILFCLTQPWHSLVFSYGVPVVRMETSATTLQMSACGGGMLAGYIVSKLTSFCDSVPPESDLHEFSQTTCTAAMNTVFPGLCSASGNSYVMGLVMIIVSLTNILLQGIAAFLAYQYISGKLKKYYRQVWFMLLVLGTGIQLMAVLCYYFFAIRNMDNIRPSIPGLTAGAGHGARIGYMLFYVAIGLEGIATILTQLAKVSREELEEERRENAKFMEEVNMHQEAVDAASSANYQQQGNYGTAASANYGYSQGAMPAQGPPPSQWGAAPPPQPAMGAAQPGMQAAW